MSMPENNFPSEKQIEEQKDRLKNKGLKRDQIADIVFTETLAGLSLEERLKVMWACATNDTFRRIKYRKKFK